MAEAISAVRFDVSADTAKLQEGMKKAEGIIRSFGSNAERAGKAAGDAIVGSLTRIGSMVAAAFGAQSLIQFGQHALEVGAQIGRLADQAGLSTTAFQELQYALRNTGVEGEQMAAAFAAFSRNLSDLQRGTGPLLDFLRQSAPQFVAQFKGVKDASEGFEVLSRILSSAKNTHDGLRLAQAAGGEQMAKLAMEAARLGPALDQARQSAHDAGRVLAEQQVRDLQKAQQAWKDFGDWVTIQTGRVLHAMASIGTAPAPDISAIVANIARLEGIVSRLTEGSALWKVRVQELRAEQEKLNEAIGRGLALSTQVTPAPPPDQWTAQQNAIKALQGELALFQAQLSTLPPQNEFISTSFAAAWEKMRQVMVANNESQAAIAAARLNMLRQEDAERMRLIGNSLTAEERLALRRQELSTERAQQLLGEERLIRLKQQAELDAAAANVGAIGQGLSAMASAWPKVKGFAIAATIANTAQGVMKAYADPTLFWPMNIAVAGMIAAAGIANIAKISSTNPGSGGGGAPAVAGGAAGGGADAGPQQPTQMVNVNLAPGRYSRDDVAGLIEQINEAQKDGVRLITTVN
jgi:hypothetical protein